MRIISSRRMDDSVSSEFNVTISSLGSSLVTSTPSRRKRKQLFAGSSETPAKKWKNPVVGVCKVCGKEYRSSKYFESHVQSHNLKRAASRYPNKQKLMENRETVILEVLNKMSKTAAIGKLGLECKQLVTCMTQNLEKYSLFYGVIYGIFINVLDKKEFCLPSVLHQTIQKVIENELTDVEKRLSFFEDLRSVDGIVTYKLFNVFLVEFVFTLGDKLLHFIVTSVVGETRGHLSPPIFISQEERQLIHYVSGATVRAFLRKALRFKTNRTWINIRSAITNCILEGDIVVAAADSDRYWTEFCNRGALLFVGKDFMEFMVTVVQLLYALEKPDGSLLYKEVQENLLHSRAAALWDKLIGYSMKEDESIAFMRGIVTSFTTTYGKGISKKHINEIMTKPKVTMSLRSRLGAKSA